MKGLTVTEPNNDSISYLIYNNNNLIELDVLDKYKEYEFGVLVKKFNARVGYINYYNYIFFDSEGIKLIDISDSINEYKYSFDEISKENAHITKTYKNGETETINHRFDCELFR